MAVRTISGNNIISTKVGSYIWYVELNLIDFIPKGKRRANHTLHLTEKENTELGAMIKATTDMLQLLKELKRS